jgi:hypothetical protein
MTRRSLAFVGLLACLSFGCTPTEQAGPAGMAEAGSTTSVALTLTPPTSPPVLDVATTAPTYGPAEPAPVDIRAELAKLSIDDRPDGSGYRRDLFMPGGRWQDPDRNGCNAREDALRAQSAPPITGRGCSTTGGRWFYRYVEGVSDKPADVDVDHMVPLANAWRSGARNWSTDRLVRYAADPDVLWVVEDNANQSKGDRGPEQWRPKERGVWCTYAMAWIAIKAKYQLTATTAERDALGQMLEEC